MTVTGSWSATTAPLAAAVWRGSRPDGASRPGGRGRHRSADATVDLNRRRARSRGRGHGPHRSAPDAVALVMRELPASTGVGLAAPRRQPAGTGPARAPPRAAAADPSADILAPKLREWPSLRRLLEVGVTMSGPPPETASSAASTTSTRGPHASRSLGRGAVRARCSRSRRFDRTAAGVRQRRRPRLVAARSGHRPWRSRARSTSTWRRPPAVSVNAGHRNARAASARGALHLLTNVSAVALRSWRCGWARQHPRALGCSSCAPPEAFARSRRWSRPTRPDRVLRGRIERRRTRRCPPGGAPLLAPFWCPTARLDSLRHRLRAGAPGLRRVRLPACRRAPVEPGPMPDEPRSCRPTPLVARMRSSRLR